MRGLIGVPWQVVLWLKCSSPGTLLPWNHIDAIQTEHVSWHGGRIFSCDVDVDLQRFRRADIHFLEAHRLTQEDVLAVQISLLELAVN